MAQQTHADNFHAQLYGSSEHPALTFNLPDHKSVTAPSRKRVEPLTREGASTAALPSEPSYLPFLPCDRDPQLLHGRPHPSLSKHGTHPKPGSVVAAYYLGTLPRPPQRDTVCTIVVAFDTNPSSAVLCVCVPFSLINQLVLTFPFLLFSPYVA